MKVLKTTLFLLLSVVLMAKVCSAAELQKRHAFNIPLALITTLFDSDNQFIEAFVTYGNSNEGWAIGPIDDRYVKDTRRERVDHFYRERPASAYQLSPFEAKIMEQVCKRFEETLVIYEKDLKYSRWSRLLYLDAYFPAFFRNFFYLYCGAHNSLSALPKVELTKLWTTQIHMTVQMNTVGRLA